MHEYSTSIVSAVGACSYGCLFLRQVRKLNIKKVDDKPMVIHTKEKTKLHVKAAPETKIKGRGVLAVDRSPKIAGVDKESGISQTDKRKSVMKIRAKGETVRTKENGRRISGEDMRGKRGQRKRDGLLLRMSEEQRSSLSISPCRKKTADMHNFRNQGRTEKRLSERKVIR